MISDNRKADIIIIGAGPAGLSAALYASRDLRRTLVFERSAVGGLITQTTEIENYPGSPEGSTGSTLTERMREQAVSLGTEIINEEVSLLRKQGEGFVVTAESGEFYSQAVIIASGTTPRLLGIPGETELRGRGVSYCATCDAAFFRGRDISVIGGGDSAIKEADYLTGFVNTLKVYVRSASSKAEASLLRSLEAKENAEIIYNTEPMSINGKFFVESITLKDRVSGEIRTEKTDGVFIFAGFIPDTEPLKDLVETNKQGYIITDSSMRTSQKGLFAAGDVRVKPLRQVITAASDGAIAAYTADEYLRSGEWK